MKKIIEHMGDVYISLICGTCFTALFLLFLNMVSV